MAAARGATLQVENLQTFLRACDRAGKESKKEVRATFREVGDVVRRDAVFRFQRYDTRTAGGYRVVVRQRGVEVEQTLRKTTGKRPDFGALQMRKALIPALEDSEETVEREMARALGRVADHFERGA